MRMSLKPPEGSLEKKFYVVLFWKWLRKLPEIERPSSSPPPSPRKLGMKSGYVSERIIFLRKGKFGYRMSVF